MSSFREKEIGLRLLEQWKQDVPFSQMVEETGFRVNKIRSLIAEAAGGANEWRKMREAKKGLLPKEIVVQKDGSVDMEAVERVAQQTVEGIFDSDTLREMVVDEVRKFPPQTGKLQIVVADRKGTVVSKKVIDNAHAALKVIIRRYEAGFTNFLLVGPAGSGKSTLAEQLALALNYEFGFLSMTSGTTEGMMYGKMSSTGKYLPADLVRLVEGGWAKGKKGAVFLLDEVDGADPNALLMLNALLANGRMSVPNRIDKPYAQRSATFILVAAANTWGTGADFQYVGRNQLDAAFLSRFAGGVLEVTYDEAVERSLTTEEWYMSFLRVRQSAVSNRIERVLGTRELMAGQKLLNAGYTIREAWEALTPGWSADEIRLSGVPTI